MRVTIKQFGALRLCPAVLRNGRRISVSMLFINHQPLTTSHQPLATLTLIALLLPLGCRHKQAALPQTVFAGHTDYINSVAFSPNGQMLATASADHSVKLWDVATGRETRALNGHTEVVAQVVFAPDGKTLASASWDHTVRLWNPANGNLLRALTGHNLAVLSIAFSSDGKRIAGGSSDNTVTIWDAQTGKLLKTLQDAENPVAFSPDGTFLATGTEAHDLKIWKRDTTGKSEQWAMLKTLPGHTESIVSVAFSPDGKAAGTGSADTDALLWDAVNWQESNRLRLHLGWVRSVTFTPDSRMFLAGAGGVVQFYDAQTGAVVKTLQTPFTIITGIALSADAKMLAVTGTFKGDVATAATGSPVTDKSVADKQMDNKAIVYTISDFLKP